MATVPLTPTPYQYPEGSGACFHFCEVECLGIDRLGINTPKGRGRVSTEVKRVKQIFSTCINTPKGRALVSTPMKRSFYIFVVVGINTPKGRALVFTPMLLRWWNRYTCINTPKGRALVFTD